MQSDPEGKKRKEALQIFPLRVIRTTWPKESADDSKAISTHALNVRENEYMRLDSMVIVFKAAA